ncbi:MAG TPA: SusC/RagA family TonB-linked outer membrane protein [Gemmatimonadaceae bacterium]|nr:SusC/RagA family TonB-linked outer membrane protein [Gemmatimonadaceae bacterium]
MVVARRLFLALTGAALWAAPLSAQQGTGTIRGRVVDALSQAPLPNVRVAVEGGTLRSATAEDGSFFIRGVPPGTRRVRASRIGYAPSQAQEVVVPAAGTVEVQFALEQQAVALSEVVATGYSTQRRLAVTGSISTIDADDANVGVAPNLTNLIQGRAPGVLVTQNSGEPGAGAQVRIRGGTSISASNEPLYVIDGVPITNSPAEEGSFGIGGDPQLARNPLNTLNPADIESISILKDASAAIYGTRAANGVVLIETKKGRAGAATMEYEIQVGSSSPAQRLNVLTGDQYRQFVQDQVSARNACLASPPSGGCDLVGFSETRLAELGTANTDWERAVTRSAATVNHNLTFSGGSNTTQYRASLNYFDQQGVVISNGMKRYQARLNGNHQALGGRLRMGLNFTGSQIRNDYVPYEDAGGFEGTVFINMVNFNPTFPISTASATGEEFFEIGSGSQSVRNPVALARQIQDVGTSTRALGNMTVELDLIADLTARLNIGADRIDGQRNFYVPRASPAGAAFQGLAQRKSRDNTTTILQTVLNWVPQFAGIHQFEMLGGYEFNEHTLSSFGAEAREFLTDAFGFNSLTAGRTAGDPPYWSYKEETRLVSFFTKANYSLLDRYFVTGVLRRDGASNFGAGNKWANFPALSASWRISEEDFFNLGPISELRLRAGWGRQGNPAVPPYASLLLFEARAGDRYVFGETPVTGITPTTNPNPDLKWEETDQTNVALDYGFSNNRFSGSLEYYVKNTRDLLLRVAVPQPAVAADRLENIGRTKNTGVEFSLNADVITRPQMTWTAGFVFSADRNEVVDLGGRTFINMGRVSGQGLSGVTAQRIMPGEAYGVFWGPQFVGWDGAGRQQFACNATSAGCVNGLSFSPTGDDYTIIGDPNPDFSIGLNTQLTQGRWDASMLIRSVRGADVFNNTALVYSAKSNSLTNKNFLTEGLSDPTGLREPAIYSSRWVEDGSFTRLQNVTVGYRLDIPRLLGSGRAARVYLSGDNLLLISGYSGLDPEVHNNALWSGFVSRGFDYLHYPRPRTFTGGVRVTF